MQQRHHPINRSRSERRVLTNLTLLGICFTVFTLVATISPHILSSNYLLSLQLTLSIPFFMSSTLAGSKLGYSFSPEKWAKFGTATFLIAYAFLINAVGIILALIVSRDVSVAFFAINIALSIVYSAMEISCDRSVFDSKVSSDALFTGVIVFLGVLPSLGLY